MKKHKFSDKLPKFNKNVVIYCKDGRFYVACLKDVYTYTSHLSFFETAEKFRYISCDEVDWWADPEEEE